MDFNLSKKLRGVMAVMLTGAAVMGVTSCNNDNGDDVHTYTLSYNFEMISDDGFNKEGYWAEVYNPAYKQLYLEPNLILSHTAESTVYDGVEYKSWYGFCPTRSTDKADHSGENWLDYQWGSITGGGAGKSVDYLLGFWDVRESLSEIPETPACAFGFTLGKNYPKSIDVTNSAYGYYSMKNGSNFNKAFGPDDWCKLIFVGVRNGQKIGTIEFYLAQNGQIVNEWKEVDLTAFGQVDAMYVQMASSDSGQFGMNNAAYFCLDNLIVYCEY